MALTRRYSGTRQSSSRHSRGRTRQLSESRHLLLTAYSPDGSSISVVCKVVADGDALGVLLVADSPVAVRIRHRPGLLVAPCDARGTRTGGQSPARAVLGTADLGAQYRAALMNKYGLTTALALGLARLAHGLSASTAVRLTPAGTAWPLLCPDWRPAGGYGYSPN